MNLLKKILFRQFLKSHLLTPTPNLKKILPDKNYNFTKPSPLAFFKICFLLACLFLVFLELGFFRLPLTWQIKVLNRWNVIIRCHSFVPMFFFFFVYLKSLLFQFLFGVDLAKTIKKKCLIINCLRYIVDKAQFLF